MIGFLYCHFILLDDKLVRIIDIVKIISFVGV